MKEEPYTLTKDQIAALNALPPGIYHVCSGCRRFQPMGTTIHLMDNESLCPLCYQGGPRL